LEKASEAANHENELLRAKVDKMTVELNEYKKTVSLMANGRPTQQSTPKLFGQSVINNINDVNFQFEFPKFGALPGLPATGGDVSKPSSKRDSSDQISPLDKPKGNMSSSNSSSYSQIGLDSQAKDDIANFSASIFSPLHTTKNGSITSRSSFDAQFSPGRATTTSSPSASSNSNMGPSSSCGTSPEPLTQSPMGFKPVDTLATIGEEHSGLPSSDQGKADLQSDST
jgi:AP-1-like factor